MSGNEQRRRIPTSDALERQGALIPAAADRRPERRGLLKFFRASRIRVSDDVAARKHVGSQHSRPPTAESGTGTPTRPTDTPPATITDSSELGSPPARASRRSPETITPRTIRLDPAIKERRGFGRSR